MVLSHCLPSLLSVSSCVFYVYHSPKWRRKSFSFCLTNSQPTLSFLFSFFRLCILVAHFMLSSFCKRLFLVCFICPASTIERNKNLPEKSQKCMCTRNPFSEPHFKRLKQSFVFSLVYSLLCWFLVIVVAVRFENGKEMNKEEEAERKKECRRRTIKCIQSIWSKIYKHAQQQYYRKLEELFIIPMDRIQRTLGHRRIK